MKFGWQMGGKKPSKGVSYGVTTSLIYFLASSHLSYHLIGKEQRVKSVNKNAQKGPT